jgi:AcrR family transcriptional regulator
MASKDRILRLKEETRTNILSAARHIVKDDGWQSLSMRKIADKIEYTAPIIYEYFANKEAILLELTKNGYALLSEDLQAAKNKHRLPAKQLEAMWMAYWHFAFREKEYYQLMFGVEMSCCVFQEKFPETEHPADLICDVITEIMKDKNPSEDEVCRRYYTFWSIVHGLVSINIVRKGVSDEINLQILKDAIGGIIRTISE